MIPNVEGRQRRLSLMSWYILICNRPNHLILIVFEHSSVCVNSYLCVPDVASCCCDT